MRALRFLCDLCGKLAKLDIAKNTALTHLNVGNNKLTKLDVSKNSALTNLSVGNNHLTELDVSQNTKLKQLFLNNNLFDAAALNALFGTLHSANANSAFVKFPDDPVIYSKAIYISCNPGSKNCDQIIAKDKGWGVDTYCH